MTKKKSERPVRKPKGDGSPPAPQTSPPSDFDQQVSTMLIGIAGYSAQTQEDILNRVGKYFGVIISNATAQERYDMLSVLTRVAENVGRREQAILQAQQDAMAEEAAKQADATQVEPPSA